MALRISFFDIRPLPASIGRLSLQEYDSTLRVKSQYKKGIFKKMCIKNLINEMEKMKKQRAILSCEKLEIIEKMKFETKEENAKNYQKMQEIDQKVQEIDQKMKKTRNFVENTLTDNFDVIDLKIFVLKYYRNQTFSKISEYVNYCEKQVQRKYRKMLDFEI